MKYCSHCGKEVADEVLSKVRASFSQDVDNMPTVDVSADTTSVIDVLTACGLCKSRGEARRLIEGGGVSVNDTKVVKWDEALSQEVKQKGEFVLHKGKKVHIRVLLKK